MRLTFHTDYAIRMLMYLAVHRDRSCRVADVADSYGISRNHLLKIALRLGRLGYVTTLRGRAGGISLALHPNEINLGTVVRQMEEDFGVVECMREDDLGCIISPACRLRGIVRKSVNAFLEVFDEYTLSDIVASREVLAVLLAAPANDRAKPKPRVALPTSRSGADVTS